MGEILIALINIYKIIAAINIYSFFKNFFKPGMLLYFILIIIFKIIGDFILFSKIQILLDLYDTTNKIIYMFYLLL